MSAEEETLSNISASPEKTMVVPSTSTAPTPTADVPPPQVAPPPTATSVAPPLPPAPPKKSWASLLRPSTSSSSASASAGPSRNALPTFSVVGISIPVASAAVQDSSLQVSPNRRTELVRLLTSGPGVGHPTAITAGVSYASTTVMTTTTTNLTPSTKIRPRGLINLGNMCFANSVLQIMVYCPLFHRLFAKLGKVLGSVGLSGVPGMNGNGAAAEASAYPLVEATVEFLKEFVVDDDRSKDLKEKGKANPNANVNGNVALGSASASGLSSRTASSRGGKGKEIGREVFPFFCRFFLLPFPLVLATMSTPSTYKSPENFLSFSSTFRMMAVRTNPEFIASKPSHRFLLTSEFEIHTAWQCPQP